MYGTLDDPPVIIEQDRRKTLTPFLVFMCFFLFSSAQLLSSGTTSGRAIYFVSLNGIFTVMFAWLLVCPNSLVLDADGITWCTPLRTFQYSWEDFAKFVTVSHKGGFSLPAGEYNKNSHNDEFSRMLRGGETRSFGGFWELDASEIVEMLNDAKKRWSKSK